MKDSRKLQEARDTVMSSMLISLEDIAGTLSAGQREPVLRTLNAAGARFRDSRLNLAIIGEFSSGKSTFINALFRREILATDMQPTTAVPTYITWSGDGAAGPYGEYAVTVYDTRGAAHSLVCEEGRRSFEALTGVSLPEEPERLIDAATTDNRLAEFVSRVTIEAPFDEGYQGICLIDTPGVNPGTEGTAGHVRVTQEVLRDAADAAIIMFPADQVYTASFGSFLEENASHLLKHSIFVITKCDIIRSEESLTALTGFVSHHLSVLGVERPEVHCISAACALDAYLDSEPRERERLWKDRFEATIQEIFRELAGRRSVIVHENVAAAADQITQLLTDSLSSQRTQLDQARSELAAVSPQNMEAECRTLLAECEIKLAEAERSWLVSVPDVIGSAIEKKKAGAFDLLDRYKTKDEVSRYLDNFNTHAFSTVKAAITQYAGQFKETLDAALTDYKQQMGECYARYHLNVSTAQVNTLEPGDAETVDAAELKSEVTSDYFGTGDALKAGEGILEGIFNGDSLLESALAVVTGVIWVPLAAVGLLLNAFRPLEGLRSAAKDKVGAALENNRENACANLTESLSKIHAAYLDAARRMPDKMVQAFSDEFREAQKIYNDRMQSTNNRIMKLNGQISRLRMIADKLDKMEAHPAAPYPPESPDVPQSVEANE